MPFRNEESRTAPGDDNAPDVVADEAQFVETEAVRVLLESMPGGLGAGYLGVATTAWVLYRLGVRDWLALWVASGAGLLTLGLLAYFRYRAALGDVRE